MNRIVGIVAALSTFFVVPHAQAATITFSDGTMQTLINAGEVATIPGTLLHDDMDPSSLVDEFLVSIDAGETVDISGWAPVGLNLLIGVDRPGQPVMLQLLPSGGSFVSAISIADAVITIAIPDDQKTIFKDLFPDGLELNNIVTVTLETSAVPVPAALPLMASALLGGAAILRRRRRII